MFIVVTMGSFSAEEMGFSVKTIPSEHQLDKTQTYFDLRVTPGITEELEIELKNNKDEEIVVLVEANTAVTNGNGIIDYSQENPEIDESLVNEFSKMAKVDPEITLKAKESKVIKIPVEIPSDPFKGIVLGGIHFSQKELDINGAKDSGVQVKNKFSYVVGVRLSESDDVLNPTMNLLDVSAGQINYRNTILAKLQNPEAHILSDITVEAYVYQEKNKNDAIFYEKKEGLAMAPNSSFSYAIGTNNHAFKPGNYLMKMTVTTMGEVFEFTEEFTINSEEAKKFNDNAVELIPLTTQWGNYFMIAIIALIVLIISFIVYVIKNKKASNTVKQKKRRKK